MKNSLAPFSSSMCPVPSALLTFRCPRGEDHVAAAAWVGIVCSRPAVLSLTIRKELKGLSRGGDFAVNLLSEDQLTSRTFLDLAGQEDIRLHPGSGLTLAAGGGIAAPIILECPVRIECRKAAFLSRYGQKLLRGEVVAVHMEGRVHGLDAPLDICSLKPFFPVEDDGRRREPRSSARVRERLH